ncbi:hypothetical protein [Pyxidicoccus xibeiensis]|uniref:hypothetical protein n=1 Tax=Pyxidicoccus xibeiensis TaxID=2906759 RepID=UPI0020A81BE2|nr:hypothetical protein [Pyxidicoccus xibeiensis]MCP3145197.1 hypothetical protein [Pyxidicoccus xibeiensis]
MPVLNCPGCGSKVAAKASICSVCDYIIDGSFLAGEPPAGDDDESTDAREDPRTAAKPAPAPRPKGKSGSRTAVPDSDSTNIRSMDDIVRSAPPRAAKSATASRPAAPPRAAPPARRAPEPRVEDAAPDPWDRSVRAPGDNPMGDPDEVIRDAKELFRLLSGGDKVAFWSAALVLFTCFLPWKETAADGDVLGLMSLGAIAFVLSIVVMTAIGIRVRESLPGVNPVIPWMAQLVSSFVCLVWCIIYIKISSDTTQVPTPIGNAEMMNSSPSIGVFVAVLGSVAMVGGTLLGLKSKSPA